MKSTAPRSPRSTPVRRIQVRRSGVHGKGVYALVDLADGETLIEYTGEVITWDEALRRHPHDPSDPNHTFYFHIDESRVIDAKFGGNSARWINHSCAPNCEAEIDGGRVYIRALRNIRAGEELFYDYGLVIDEPYTKTLKAQYPCWCGAPACRGTLLAPKRAGRATAWAEAAMATPARDTLLAGHLETVWTQVAPWLPGFSVEALAEIDSSNAELMRRARAGQTDACLLVAEHQTAGRGRMGKRWVGEPGDALTFSLGLPLAPHDWSGLSLAVGLALAQALHPRVRLKWPNDLWLDGRKLGGILVETANLSAPTTARWVVVGVGINLRLPSALPPTTAAAAAPPVPPAAVAEWWPQARVGQVLEAVAAPLAQALLRFEREGFAPLAAAFAERDALRGLRVNISNGQTGLADGVDASGALRLVTDTGPLVLTQHEVSVRPC